MDLVFLTILIVDSLILMFVLLFFHDEVLLSDATLTPDLITCLTEEVENAKTELEALRGDHGD